MAGLSSGGPPCEPRVVDASFLEIFFLTGFFPIPFIAELR